MLLAISCAGPLPRAERIVFFGDSITEEGNSPGGYVDLIRNAMQNTGNVTVTGAGVSGDRVPDLLERLENDVMSHRPTTVVIYIGINDVWHKALGLGGTPPDTFETGLRNIVRQIADTGARVILCTPSVVGEKYDGTNPLDPELDRYAAITRGIAKSMGCGLCDLRAIFLLHLGQFNPDNRDTGILTRDGVHLNGRGNTLVAESLLLLLSPASAGTRRDDVEH
ncbi:MAG: GDSL-type esterase/lipase family protein [Ignavibacteria bacterium]|nr:GDSL-type esterase/lipase family protein [Ignavibacteria bacterium]